MKQQNYLKGKENAAIRTYFYINSGLTIMNNFRNLGLGIFALYFALKLTNPLYLILMVIVALPILAVIGYYNVHTMAKVIEWLSVKFSTHYGIKQYTFIEKQTQYLKKIAENTLQKKK